MQMMNNSLDSHTTTSSTTESGMWKERWERILGHPIEEPMDELDWAAYHEYLLLRTKEYEQEKQELRD